MSKLWCCVGLCFFSLVLWPQGAHANEKKCVRLYQAKKLLAAADCFVQVAAGLATGGASHQRVMRGRALRNAASLLAKAAKGTKRTEEALLWRERASRLLKRYLTNKLYELESQQESATLQMYALRQQVGYAHLTVVSYHQQALLTVEGFKFTHKSQGRWSRRVRPGRYTITWQYEGEQRTKTITLDRKAIKVEVFGERKQATAPVAKKRMLPLVLFAAGGGAMLVGGVLLGAAEGVDHQKVQQNLELLAEPSMSTSRRAAGVKEIESLQGQAQALYIVGWTFFGLGVAAAVGGAVLMFLPKKQSAQQPPTPPPPARKARLLRARAFVPIEVQ